MKKFTLFLMSMFLFLGTAMAQDYSLTETRLSSDKLNAKTASTLIAIKNLQATNNYYFVGNTGAAPYSAADFSDTAVFVWQPVEEGVAGSYYLMKPDGTYMQATSPVDFGTVDGAAVFTAANPTTANGQFNGDPDSQEFIDDEALLVRFMNTAAGNWLNVQHGEFGTPVYNNGKGGWTIHYVYAVEAPAVEPEPEVPAEGALVLNLTAEQIGEAPYQLSDEDAAKVFALSDLTVAVKVNTPAAMSGRCALFCTSDPTQAANTDAMGMNSAYVAYGTNNHSLGYLTSCKAGDRFTAGNVPTATEGVILVYVISPTNNLCQLYVDGTLAREWNNVHADGFMVGYEIATPQMVKADHADANIYIGGGMTAEGAREVFTGAVTGVEVYNGALTAEEIANVFAATEPEPEVETFAVTADLYPTVEGDIKEIKGIRVETGQGPALADLPTGWTLTNEAGDEFTMDIEWLYNYETILIMVNPAITEAGTYTLTIPAGSLTTDDDKECEAAEFSWTIVGGVEPLVKVSTDETRYYYKIASFNRGGYLSSVGDGAGVQHVAETFASYWYFTKADNNGGVYFHNYTSEQTLGADRAMSDNPAVWYVLPNGINEEGYAISSTNPISGGSCVDANNYNTGVGSWSPIASDWHGTTWVFSEVDVDAMIAELQAARDAFDAAYAEAQSILTEANLQTTTEAVALQTTDETAAGYVWANTYAYGEEGVIAYLVDGDINTFFHTDWVNYATDGTKDYLEVDLGEGNELAEFCINYVTRHNSNTDFPASITILGSNDKSEYTEIATISEGLPVGNSKSYTSPVLGNGNAYRYIRYQVNSTSRGNADIPYFHLAEFGISTASISIAEKYANVVAEISALEVLAGQLAENTEYGKDQLVAATEAIKAAIEEIKNGLPVMAKIYHITAKDTARGALYASAEEGYLSHCGATYGNYHHKDIAADVNDPAQQFALVEYEGATYLYAIGAQRFAVKDGQYIKLTENPEGIVTVVDSDVEGYKNILLNGTNKLNFSGGYTYGTVANWEYDDDGNRVLLTEVGEFNADELLASMEAYFVAKEEALAAARAAFDAAYAEAQSILTEANLQTTTEAVALQTTDETAAGYVWANTYAYGEEGVIAYLVDGDTGTFFHTNWGEYATDGTKDYLEVDLGEGNELAEFCINYVTRHNGNTDFPTSITLLGSNDKSEYTEIATISEGLPVGNSKSYTSPVLGNGNAYRYIRYQVNSTSRGNADIPYFHLAEFGISTASISIAEKYANVVAEISALEVIAEQLANNAEYSKEQLVAATTTLYAALKAIEEGFTTKPEVETFAVTASLFPTVDGDVTEIMGIRVEAGQGPLLADLPTTWTLTNEAGDEFKMNIEWLYDYETILIMVNPAITEAGTYTLTIPAGSLTTDDGKECEAATFSWTIVNNYKPGDINKDDNITISDVVLTVNALKGIISDESVLNAADMNCDGKITISDVVRVVNALLNYQEQKSAPMRVASRYSVDTDRLHVSDASINGNEATMTVKLDNADRYNAIQLDLNLPDGVSIKNVTMNGNHTVAYNDSRIVAYSLTNRAFGAQEDIMSITLNVEDEVEYAEITFDNIFVTTTELDEQRLNAVGARIDGTTGIVDNVESTTRIYTESNCIVIETANDDVAEIVTANGIVNKAAITAGKNCIAIEHKGLYVVKVGNKAAKVVF